jgi:hypothetical protein
MSFSADTSFKIILKFCSTGFGETIISATELPLLNLSVNEKSERLLSF